MLNKRFASRCSHRTQNQQSGIDNIEASLGRTQQETDLAVTHIREAATAHASTFGAGGISAKVKVVTAATTVGAALGAVAGPLGVVAGTIAGAAVGSLINQQAQDPAAETYRFESSRRWERDDATPNCRGCSRQFSMLVRKHHCRSVWFGFVGLMSFGWISTFFL